MTFERLRKKFSRLRYFNFFLNFSESTVILPDLTKSIYHPYVPVVYSISKNESVILEIG